MADVEARREARRRRILENAEIRLKKITNADLTDPIIDKSEKLAEVDRNNKQGQQNSRNHLDLEQNSIENRQEINNFQSEEQEDAFPEASNLTNQQQEFQSLEENGKTDNLRYFVIFFIGFSVRHLNSIILAVGNLLGTDLSYLYIETIFVPFLLFEVTEFFVARPKVEVNSTFQLLLVLSNVNTDRIKQILIVFNRLFLLLNDMSVYFFAFIYFDLVFTIVDKFFG